MRLKYLIIIINTSIFFAQSIPVELNDYKSYDSMLDRGLNWESNSLLYGPRWQSFTSVNDNLDSLNFLFDLISFNNYSKNKFNYGFGLNIRTYFYEYFYTYLYARFANEEKSFDRYSGISRKKKRFGISTGEVDMSGLGFDNNRFNFEIGRGRVGQGAGSSEIQLSLNQESSSYDFVSYGIKLATWRIRFFNGFLENINFINRYISGRSIEKIIKKNFLISFSETVIYSGENRPIDLAYLNPISSHLEIELNNRQNLSGTASGNAVWEASLDWLIKQKTRISANIIVDEFVLDQIQIDQGKIHSTGSAIRVSLQPFKIYPFMIFYLNIVNAGTYLYKHENGYNNFVNRDGVLGWKNGNDSKQIALGLTNIDENLSFFKFELAHKSIGEGSIFNGLYEPYIGTLIKPDGFPSGKKHIRTEATLIYQRNVTKSVAYNVKLKSEQEYSDFNASVEVNCIFSSR